jgi:methylenetetrahydrofolate reductase (NADPH)
MASTRIIDLIRERRTLSFEIFPPKPAEDADLSGIFSAVRSLSAATPDFMSVTYSPTGTNKGRALEIAKFVLSVGVTPLSHFTAVGYTRGDAEFALAGFKAEGITNVLGLRGDVPPGVSFPRSPWVDFRYARDLIAFVREDPAFCVGAACYPEVHPESGDETLDLIHLKEKVDAGADFLVAQLFFDNSAFYRFRDRARSIGLSVPILAGIMPVYRAGQIDRIRRLSGCSIPLDFARLLEKFAGDDEGMERAGSDYAVAQIRDLSTNGVDGVHLYTMNKSRQALAVVSDTGLRA